MSAPRLPAATYRLQMNSRFGFADARKLVPYLKRLGISDLYSSPIAAAQPGSTHCYDITDPSRLNPELGTGKQFEALAQALRGAGMGLLLDIVPNHMAASPANPWWRDILENGAFSPYADHFDIDWQVEGNRVLLPLLGSPRRQALAKGELRPIIADSGSLSVSYHGYALPLDVRSYRLLLSQSKGSPGQASAGRLRRLVRDMQRLPPLSAASATKHAEYLRRQRLKGRFQHLLATDPQIKALVLENVRRSHSLEVLERLLGQQAYRLAYWKAASGRLNYRRFFDINHLVGVRVELPQVFDATHSLTLRLVRQGKVSGLRIDHIDGLRDPLEYLLRLQRGTNQGIYIVVEKILAGYESLPAEWPVCGTTGYDFLNAANALFVDGAGAQELSAIYKRLTEKSDFAEIVYQQKKRSVRQLFPAEVRALARRLSRLNRKISAEELARALIEITACLPVYRTYTRSPQVTPRDRLYLEKALLEAERHGAPMAALRFLRRVLLLDFPAKLSSRQRAAWLEAVLRWQRLSGAVTAKGFEDTALYNYNRLVSLNEVGGSPDSDGLTADGFHRLNLARQAGSPHTLNATATHDTKRGEDVRARINVLSWFPAEWQRHLARWRRWNRPQKRRVKGRLVPGPEMELLLYQTLLGAWPLDTDEAPQFRERLREYLIKASREAKSGTSWLAPDHDYEEALLAFAAAILDGRGENRFLADFLPFQRHIAQYGAINSLSQVLLKITSPGVPDFYQGTELWDFSLVDPDNRRPVDFSLRKRLLDSIIRQETGGTLALAQETLARWQDGRVKLYVIYQVLRLRNASIDLFRRGEYLPLALAGEKGDNLCAFARRWEGSWAVTLVPRLLTKLPDSNSQPLGEAWGNTRLLLPEDSPLRWRNVLTGEELKTPSGRRALAVADVLGAFPVALLANG